MNSPFPTAPVSLPKEQPPRPVFVSCPGGLEDLLLEEIHEIIKLFKLETPRDMEIAPGGVHLVNASLDLTMALILGSGLAHRVFWSVGQTELHSLENVVEYVKSVPWHHHFGVGATFRVHAITNSSLLQNPQILALKVKDGIADCFRAKFGMRPNVDTKDPQVTIQAYLQQNTLHLSIDLVGRSLHQRHGETRESEAPLRETLAHAMLRLAGYHALSRQLWEEAPLPVYYNRITNTSPTPSETPAKRRIPEKVLILPFLMDPFMGSGTILLEAAFMLLNRKPNCAREDFSFVHLTGGELFSKVKDKWVRKWIAQEKNPFELQAAVERYLVAAGFSEEQREAFPLTLLHGSDKELKSVHQFQNKMRNLGLTSFVKVSQCQLEDVKAPAAQGICLTNPPYGERLMQDQEVGALYQQLGNLWKHHFKGWTGWLLSSNEDAIKKVGLRHTRQFGLFNGNLKVKLMQYIIY